MGARGTGWGEGCLGISVYPVPSLGSALFAVRKAMTQLRWFIVAPIAGGLCAALVRNVFLDN